MVTSWSRQGSKWPLPSFEIRRREDQRQEWTLEMCLAETAIFYLHFLAQKEWQMVSQSQAPQWCPVFQRFLQWEQLPALSSWGHPISEPSVVHSAHPSPLDLADRERDQSHSHPSQVSKPWLALRCLAVQVNRKKQHGAYETMWGGEKGSSTLRRQRENTLFLRAQIHYVYFLKEWETLQSRGKVIP